MKILCLFGLVPILIRRVAYLNTMVLCLLWWDVCLVCFLCLFWNAYWIKLHCEIEIWCFWYDLCLFVSTWTYVPNAIDDTMRLLCSWDFVPILGCAYFVPILGFVPSGILNCLFCIKIRCVYFDIGVCLFCWYNFVSDVRSVWLSQQSHYNEICRYHECADSHTGWRVGGLISTNKSMIWRICLKLIYIDCAWIEIDLMVVDSARMVISWLI